MPATEKRVFHLRVQADNAAAWRLIAVSSDCTLADLHRTIQGAFGTFEATAYTFTFGSDAYAMPIGSRTPLKRLLTAGMRFTYDGDRSNERLYQGEVVESELVASRRHYPKVLDGGGKVCGGRAYDERISQWDAQAMKREQIPLDVDVHTFTVGRLLEMVNPNGPLTGSDARLHGFLCGLVAGPMVMPSQWMHQIFGEPEWPSLELAHSAMQLLMSTYNGVARELEEGRIRGDVLGADWCEGFMFSVVFSQEAWNQALTRDAHLHRAIGPIVEGSQGVKVSDAVLVEAVFQARDWWRENLFAPSTPYRRSESKVSPNDPCTCGSGRKYKKCCSPLRAVP